MKRKIAAVALICGILGSSHAQDNWDQGFESAVYESNNSTPTGFEQFRSSGTRNSSPQSPRPPANQRSRRSFSQPDPSQTQPAPQAEQWAHRRQANNRFSAPPDSYRQPQERGQDQRSARKQQYAKGQSYARKQSYSQRPAVPRQPSYRKDPNPRANYSQRQRYSREPTRRRHPQHQSYGQSSRAQDQHPSPAASGQQQRVDKNYVINNITGKKMYLSDIERSPQSSRNPNRGNYGSNPTSARSYAPKGQQWSEENVSDNAPQRDYTVSSASQRQDSMNSDPWASRAMEASQGVRTSEPANEPRRPSRRITSSMQSKPPMPRKEAREQNRGGGGFRLPNPFRFLQRLNPF